MNSRFTEVEQERELAALQTDSGTTTLAPASWILPATWVTWAAGRRIRGCSTFWRSSVLSVTTLWTFCASSRHLWSAAMESRLVAGPVPRVWRCCRSSPGSRTRIRRRCVEFLCNLNSASTDSQSPVATFSRRRLHNRLLQLSRRSTSTARMSGRTCFCCSPFGIAVRISWRLQVQRECHSPS